MTEHLFVVEIAVGVGLPMVGLVVAIARYFYKKEQCFLRMRTKIEELAEHHSNSLEEHNGFHGRLENIEVKQTKNEIYLKLLLDKFNIPYSP